ncbi:MAG: tetratricopeptide repeat protein [Bacteroides sp.]|nr:tetratricopeptide repeat protein [Roseburia sp.]MCM1346772.1 tetratricopeptide repeat protein [Bacteroides sp.]MCM1420662.1 tetratricopeptide repeat protein [Bacteroides sp.]
MNKDFFESQEFQDKLASYELSDKLGQTCYFDTEDFVDISDYYLEHNQPDNAMRAIEQGLLIHKDNNHLQTIKAGILIYKHQFDEARDIMRQLSDYTNNEVIYINAQLAYAIDHNIRKAEDLFCEWLEKEEKALKENYQKNEREDIIRDDYIHVIMSFVELSDERHEEIAKKWIDKYIKRFAPLGNYDSDMLLADICRDEGMVDYVEQIYTLLLETNPYLDSGWTILATAQNINGKLEEAINSADFALAVNPNDYDAVLAKAHSYYSMNDTDSALPLFQKYIDKTDDHSQYLYLGMCHILAENSEEGYKYIKGAQDFYESKNLEDKYIYASMCYEIADVYNTGRFYTEAEETIDKALSIAPDNPDYLLLKGSILLAFEEIENSLRYFAQAMLNTHDRVRTYIHIGIRFMSFELHEIAVFMFNKALEEEDNPERIMAHAYLAYIFFHTKQYEEFLDHLRIACKESPEAARSLFSEIFPNVEPEEYYTFVTSTRKFTAKNMEEEHGKEI